MLESLELIEICDLNPNKKYLLIIHCPTSADEDDKILPYHTTGKEIVKEFKEHYGYEDWQEDNPESTFEEFVYECTGEYDSEETTFRVFEI